MFKIKKMYRLLLNRSKKLLPKIPETELIALRSGTVSIDRDIFNGNVNVDTLNPIKKLIVIFRNQ